MPYVYYQYRYTRFEAKPSGYDSSELATVPGTDATYSVYGIIWDPNETTTYPYNDYGPNTHYDYYKRSIGTITNIKPEGGSGTAPGFDDLNWQPNAWGRTFLDDEEYEQLIRDIPPELNSFGVDSSSGNDLFSGWTGSLGTAKISWSAVPGQKTTATLSLRSAYDYAMDYAAAVSPTLSNLMNAFDRVESLSTALNSVIGDSLDVLEYGIGNFSSLSATEYSDKVDELLKDSYGTLLQEAENQLGATPAASTLFKSINLTAGYLNGGHDLEVSYSDQIEIDGIAIIGLSTSVAIGGTGRDAFIVAPGDEDAPGPLSTFQMKGGNDTFVGSDKSNEQFLGGNGKDSAVMGGGADIAYGGNGDDVLHGGNQGDLLSGNQGDDEIFGEGGKDSIMGSGGEDSLFGGKGDDDLFGGANRDFLVGGTGDDELEGNAAIDMLFGDAGNDIIKAGGGDDSIYGGGDDDVITAGNGRDLINPGGGDDTVSGGAGSDHFVFKNGFGTDQIRDFSVGMMSDVLDLRAVSGVLNFTDLKNNHLSQSNGNAMINDGNGSTILLIGINRSDLEEDHFLF